LIEFKIKLTFRPYLLIMSKLVAKLSDGSCIEFDTGKFDNWCVYLKRLNQIKYAPKDVEYFGILKNFALKYGNQKIYTDFVKIYETTTKNIENKVVELIIKIALNYGQDKNEMSIWFTILYAGMVAEENKEYAILKKRIKRLGVYQVLIENLSPEYAANFSRGKKWNELDKICREREF
jgi:hypothetical protein